MASSGSEHVDYDDDFEHLSSDDDGVKDKSSQNGVLKRDPSSSFRRRREAEAKPHEAEEIAQPEPVTAMEKATAATSSRAQADSEVNFASSRPPSQPGSSRPGRRVLQEPKDAALRSATEEAVEMNMSGGSFTNTAGRRPVRAKISVGGSDERIGEPADRRPGTGDSSGKASASRPIWLQSDDRQVPKPGSQGGTPARSLSGDRPSHAVSASPPPRPADPMFASGGGRGRPPLEPDQEFDLDGRASTADGDRKVKRLQQEIQRLTARLKEAELYSAQDEGLPVFNLDEVEVGVQIAQGGFSSVHHAMWRSTPCALKKIFDPVITDELRGEFENEVRMLRRLRHPNVIIIMAVCRVPPALSILCELVSGGSMFELLHGPPQARRPNSIDCEPQSLLPVMQQSSAALAYLHAMLVVHRDVKSHNVLLTPGRFPVAKLCDFGLARPKSELGTGTMQWAGTACYMAPELFAKRRYTEAVDVFAFGVMLWETMSTEIPHANMEPADIAHRVQKQDGAGLPVMHGWPKSLKALLRTCLAVQAEDRPSMVSIGQQLSQVVMDFPAPE